MLLFSELCKVAAFLGDHKDLQTAEYLDNNICVLVKTYMLLFNIKSIKEEI